MTQKQLIQLLKQLLANYPNATSKIDSKELLKNWEMAFGEYQAEEIYMAARYHMDVSPYFPTIADIKKSIGKGKMIYQTPPQAPRIAIESDFDEQTGKCKAPCPYAEIGICQRTEAEYDKCWI